MPVAASQRLLLVLASAGCFALVATAQITLERPGLGIGHLFYIAIALAAIATNARVGAAAGVAAGALYGTSLVVNPALHEMTLATGGTVIRVASYVTTGALIGWFAASNRDLVNRLRSLADTDSLTALPNVRRFDGELVRHLRDAGPFALLVADLDGLKEINDRDGHAAGNTLLRRAAAGLHELTREHDLTARIGGDEFAVIARVDGDADAAVLAADLERELDRRGVRISIGWALHPGDGRTSAELLHRADERLYRSKAVRKSRDTVVGLLTGAIATAS